MVSSPPSPFTVSLSRLGSMPLTVVFAANPLTTTDEPRVEIWIASVVLAPLTMRPRRCCRPPHESRARRS